MAKEEADALNEFKEVDTSMTKYQQYFGINSMPVDQTADPEPTLTNYYTPSDDIKMAEIIGIVLGMALTTYIAYKVGQRNWICVEI